MSDSLSIRAVLIAWLVLAACHTHAVTYPPKPEERGFISDAAGLLSEADKEELRKALDETLTATAIPILVVTIPSMAEYNAPGMAIETYARMLYDAWEIGHLQVGVQGRGMGRTSTQDWNKGVLLLVSVGDRQARIELGAGFGTEKNALSQEIMATHIVPRFKQGDFPGGIKGGVKALSQMAAGEKIAPPPRPWWHYAVVIGGIALTIFTIVSLSRRGSSGWAWVFWAALLGLMWYLIITMLRNSGRSSGGSSGGFSGGSFGGGYSGGGGATGSW